MNATTLSMPSGHSMGINDLLGHAKEMTDAHAPSVEPEAAATKDVDQDEQNAIALDLYGGLDYLLAGGAVIYIAINVALRGYVAGLAFWESTAYPALAGALHGAMALVGLA